ncbi:hypothetical protein ABFU56_21505 [Xanthomonas campestris pv. campestris]|uniref:hypothetical protein n=1 Tax=Xanthomonas campestris TaxID=339 RepID=UPI0021B3C5D5|nr:hypothetical protein [Xanthomonas campestris]
MTLLLLLLLLLLLWLWLLLLLWLSILPLPYRGPFRSGGDGGQTPPGRRARMRDVFGRDRMFLPKIPAGSAHPKGAKAGCAFFWLRFFAQAKKSDSRPRGRESPCHCTGRKDRTPHSLLLAKHATAHTPWFELSRSTGNPN